MTEVIKVTCLIWIKWERNELFLFREMPTTKSQVYFSETLMIQISDKFQSPFPQIQPLIMGTVERSEATKAQTWKQLRYVFTRVLPCFQAMCSQSCKYFKFAALWQHCLKTLKTRLLVLLGCSQLVISWASSRAWYFNCPQTQAGSGSTASILQAELALAEALTFPLVSQLWLFFFN